MPPKSNVGLGKGSSFDGEDDVLKTIILPCVGERPGDLYYTNDASHAGLNVKLLNGAKWQQMMHGFWKIGCKSIRPLQITRVCTAVAKDKNWGKNPDQHKLAGGPLALKIFAALRHFTQELIHERKWIDDIFFPNGRKKKTSDSQAAEDDGETQPRGILRRTKTPEVVDQPTIPDNVENGPSKGYKKKKVGGKGGKGAGKKGKKVAAKSTSSSDTTPDAKTKQCDVTPKKATKRKVTFADALHIVQAAKKKKTKQVPKATPVRKATPSPKATPVPKAKPVPKGKKTSTPKTELEESRVADFFTKSRQQMLGGVVPVPRSEMMGAKTQPRQAVYDYKFDKPQGKWCRITLADNTTSWQSGFQKPEGENAYDNMLAVFPDGDTHRIPFMTVKDYEDRKSGKKIQSVPMRVKPPKQKEPQTVFKRPAGVGEIKLFNKTDASGKRVRVVVAQDVKKLPKILVKQPTAKKETQFIQCPYTKLPTIEHAIHLLNDLADMHFSGVVKTKKAAKKMLDTRVKNIADGGGRDEADCLEGLDDDEEDGDDEWDEGEEEEEEDECDGEEDGEEEDEEEAGDLEEDGEEED